MARQYFYSDLTEDERDLLTPVQTEIFKLKEKDHSWDEIAMIRGSSVSSAKSNYFTGKKKVKQVAQELKALDKKAAKRMTIHEMADSCDRKAGEILDLMTRDSISAATLAQKASAFGILIEKGRLLRGESTQIITHDDRRTLKDIIPAFLKEAERRGITLEGEYATDRE